MNNFRRRLFLIAAVLLILTTCAISAVNGATTLQTIKAYSGVKILYNDKELTGAKQPYLINDSTYVPLRLLIESFGDKSINWDPVNYRVIINDLQGTTEADLRSQLAQKDAEIASLKSSNASLSARVVNLETQIAQLDDCNSDSNLSDIEDELDDAFKDAGDEYFNDEGISVDVSLDGDEDELEYKANLDFDDADYNDDLTELAQTDLKTFLRDVKSEINDEIDGTEFEGADITGKVVDDNNSSYYVRYNGTSYTFSWDGSSLSDIEDTLNNYFEDAGYDYFDDDGIVVDISLDGDEDDLEYEITLDFDDADNNNYLTDLSQSDLRTFLNAVKSKINNEIDGTDFEDADITGKAVDNDNSSYYVRYNGSSYTFSWSE
ncbi:MAG: hypothetical protein A4E53_02698 [Pelotomaculum sp. PtaB.Bin104]|nr:MAG: hypothetical protein A4E53_02698 [Pelotomaculum sp. PtaB.Bin104]